MYGYYGLGYGCGLRYGYGWGYAPAFYGRYWW